MLTPTPLNEARIAAFVRGEVSADERAAIEAEIDRDPRWLAVIAVMVRLGDDTSVGTTSSASIGGDDIASEVERDQRRRVVRGTVLGRYTIEAPLGRGGMGVVYAAVDPQLGRRVALKLLHGGAVDQARLVREARALARVADPRVLAILDVGTWQGRVFVVTEHLDGVTLQAWRATGTPHWRRVVEVYLEAARGLAAAHRRGVLHRDFKPANVMVLGDGRVVVLDFGLARIDDERDPSHDHSHDRDVDGVPSPESTMGGRLVGTPAYMAPEQRDGRACGPAADQFAFAVALHAALFGRFPEQACHPAARVEHGAARGRVPLALRRGIDRALADDPSARHASMDALIARLESSLRRSSVLPAVAIAAPLLVVAAMPRAPAADPCAEPHRSTNGVLDAPRLEALGDALAQSDRPWSREAAQAVVHELADYGDTWDAAHVDACAAASEDQLACLDRRRIALVGLVDALQDGTQDGSMRALAAVATLPAIAPCTDADALRRSALLPEEPAARAEVEAARGRLDRVGMLRELARFGDAETLARASLDEAMTLGSGALEAEARIALAAVLADRGQYDGADVELDTAANVAIAAGHDEATAIAWIRRAALLGMRRGRVLDADELLARAQVWLRRLGEPTPLMVERLRTSGSIALDAGDPAAAREAFEQGLALVEPTDATELALLHHGLGSAARAQGDLDVAGCSFTAALDRLEARVGADHPNVARVQASLASVLRMQGDAAGARALLQTSLDIVVAAHGDTQPVVGETLLDLAVAELDLGLPAEALAHLQQAEDILVRDLGPTHPIVAKLVGLRGDALTGLGRPREAIAALARARTMLLELYDGPHPELAILDANLGSAHADLGELDAAAACHLRAIDGLERTLGPEHPDLAVVLVMLGQARRGQGRLDEAIALHRRAIELAPPPFSPYARGRLGELLVEHGRHDEGAALLAAAVPELAQFDVDPRLVADLERALADARADR